MASEIKFRNPGDGTDEAQIAELLVRVGDTVVKDQALLEFETEKASATMTSDANGKIVAVLVKKGDFISVGQALFRIETVDCLAAQPPPPGPAKSVESAKPTIPSTAYPSLTETYPPTDDISLTDRPTNVGPLQPTQALPPSENGRYRNPHEIGRGGMGVVWKVYDSKLDRFVAIKRVLPNLENYSEIAKRFLTEARALAKLSHPNIVSIYDQGQDADGSYIVMEYVEGANLLELIKEQSTLPVADATRLIRKICEGLIEAHQAQVIHRDIKPSNILVDKNGRAKLTDFGLARAGSGSGHSLSGHVLGTEGYMAPEQYADPRQATALSDQYSLAATLYHVVTGRSPRMIHLRYVPGELQELLATALDEAPRNRFPSMAAFHEALGQVARRDKPQPAPETAKPTANEASEGDSNLAQLYVELKQRAEQNVALAGQCYEAYDDEQALALLRSVPEDLRDASLEQKVAERWEQGKKLATEIGQRVRGGKTAGLRALVDQYLKWYPKNADMLALRAQLPKPQATESKPAGSKSAESKPAESKPAAAKQATAPALLQAPFDARAAGAGQQAWADYLGRPVEWTNSIGMKFRLIPPGEFLMGSPETEEGASSNERPQHRVRLTQPFYLGMYPVTQAEYQQVMGKNPSNFTSYFRSTGNRPVDTVSWEDAQAFLQALRGREKGQSYGLPSEAQWEYACRAGTLTPYWFGSQLNGQQANCNGNYPHGTATNGPYLEKTVPVGQYPANPFGLYDQHGQVWEWCQDWYGNDYYQQFKDRVAVDPTGPTSGSSRCLRGGSWNNNAVNCRSGYRGSNDPAGRNYGYGFRVLLVLS